MLAQDDSDPSEWTSLASHSLLVKMGMTVNDAQDMPSRRGSRQAQGRWDAASGRLLNLQPDYAFSYTEDRELARQETYENRS